MSNQAMDAPIAAPRAWLAFEFALLYLAAPTVMAFFLLGNFIWWAMAGVTVVGIGLLAATRAFRWRSLIEGGLVPAPWIAIGFTCGAVALILGLTYWLAPRLLFAFPRFRPELWLLVMLLYPILSALPQELVFRVLFFQRYGPLFANRSVALFANGAVFGLAHLFYWNWPAILLTAPAGVIFAWVYTVKRSFAFTCLLHAIAGWLLFTIGLGGRYFFHGTIPGT